MVKFISYEHGFSLCFGVLTVAINGNQVSFENCLISGGDWYILGEDSDYEEFVRTGPWSISADEIPEEYREYIPEIEKVVNENVEFGCCGACI